MFTPGNEIWDNDSELANYTKLCGNGQKQAMIILPKILGISTTRGEKDNCTESLY